MSDEAFCWLLDRVADSKIFFKSKDNKHMDGFSELAFGRRLNRSSLYKRAIKLSEIPEIIEKAYPDAAPHMKWLHQQFMARDWGTALIGFLAEYLPGGGLTLYQLAFYSGIDAEIGRLKKTGDLRAARQLILKKLNIVEIDLVENAQSFEGLADILRGLRILHGVEVMATFAWDCNRHYSVPADLFRALFPGTEKNQRGTIKTPQRKLYEWMELVVAASDKDLGFKRKKTMRVRDVFFNSDSEFEKYLKGDKRLCLEEFDERWRRLWPENYYKDRLEDLPRYIDVVMFVFLGQHLYEATLKFSQNGSLEAQLLKSLTLYDKFQEDLRVGGGVVEAKIFEKLKEQVPTPAP